MINKLYSILDKITELKYSEESEIREKICNFIKQECTGKKIKPSPELLYEKTAFTFMEMCTTDTEQFFWEGIPYGPIFSARDKDDNMITVPDLKDITPEVINYWKKRSTVTNNPILQCRYAGLVWYFSSKVGQKAGVSIALQLIDSSIQIALLDKKRFHIQYKLKRGLDTAISINDQNRILKVRDAIIQHEDTRSEDKRLGTWGYAFDWLVMDKKLSKKVKLSKQQEKAIIQKLEDRLKILSNDFHTLGVEHVATKLAPYYKDKNDINNLKRVLLKYRDCFLNAPLPALAGESILNKVRDILFQYGLSKEANEMEPTIRRFQKESLKGLKKFETKTNIPKEETDNHYSELNKRSLFEALHYIARRFVPDKEQSKKTALKLSQEYPLGFLISQHIKDHVGRTTAQIESSKEGNLEKGHIIRQMRQSMDMNLLFIFSGFQYLEQKKSLNVDSLSEHLFKSPVFPQTHHQIIKQGLKEFFAENYIASCSILTPQIETAVREIIKHAGGNIYKPPSNSKEKGFVLRPLGDLLRDENFTKIFKEYKNIPEYLLILLVDKRGYNLRNNICHGDVPSNGFDQARTFLLIHALLLLALIQVKQNEDK